MLLTSTFIDSPVSTGGSNYNLNLYFSPATASKFARIGDVITDKVGNEYGVSAPTILPLFDGALVSVQAITNNVLPAQDTSYNSSISTPGQVDSTPPVRTGGIINSSTLVSGPDYAYRISASWDSATEANKSVIGDRVVDSKGKEFGIVSFDSPLDKWGDTVVIEEIEKEGDGITIGAGSLFRPTAFYKFYQGAPITDPARTVAYNRDSFYQDSLLKYLIDNVNQPSKTLSTTLYNSSISSILRGTPICSSNGDASIVDVSSEQKSLSTVGVALEDISPSSTGSILISGLLEDISIIGDVDSMVYISKTGELTTTPPIIGSDGFIEGDFCVIVGIITKNQNDSLKKDLLLNICITQL